MGVPTTGIGKHEDLRAFDRILLKAAVYAGSPSLKLTVSCQTNETHVGGSKPSDLSGQRATSPLEIFAYQIPAGSRRAGGDVGETNSQIEKVRIFLISQPTRREPRFMQESPETIIGTGEVVAHLGRPKARVDTHQDQLETRAKVVGKSLARHEGSHYIPWETGAALDAGTSAHGH